MTSLPKFAIDEATFKEEVVDLCRTNPEEAADICFELFQRCQRMESEAEEATALWREFTQEISDLKRALANSKKKNAKDNKTNEETIADLQQQLAGVQAVRSDRTVKYEDLRSAKDQLKTTQKQLKQADQEAKSLRSQLTKANKKIEKMPLLLANLKKLAARKKELIQEKKFEENRKKLYLDENRVLKQQARENVFKVYDCNYHLKKKPNRNEDHYLKFKNEFYNVNLDEV